MLWDSPGKEIEENVENLSSEAVTHSPCLLQSSYSSFSPTFGFTLFSERKEEITYLEAVLASAVLTKYKGTKS